MLCVSDGAIFDLFGSASCKRFGLFLGAVLGSKSPWGLGNPPTEMVGSDYVASGFAAFCYLCRVVLCCHGVGLVWFGLVCVSRCSVRRGEIRIIPCDCPQLFSKYFPQAPFSFIL